MSDYCAWIPYVNRPDLLKKAVDSVAEYGNNLTIIDNSPAGDRGVRGIWKVYQPCVPLSCSQTFNLIMKATKTYGAKMCVWMHNDAEAEPGTALKLVEFARQLIADKKKWGTVFTSYDALAVLNVELLDVIGEWDVVLPQYYTDNDFYRRMRLAGYESFESHLPVKHEPSQTLKSDPYRQVLNSVTFPLYGFYYEQKWGGRPGEEKYLTAFNQ